ncbi:MAG: ATP-grasp domain-containing protein [Burkholderiaceae bacterium]
MTKVLFTGGGGAGNEALWRLLGSRYELHFGDADEAAIDPAIPAGRRHALPWASTPDFAAHMAQLCANLSIDLLVPGVDEELLPLARALSALASTRLLLPQASYVHTMTDKWLMVQSLVSQSLPVPRSMLLSENFQGLQFPCIAKPRQGRGSRDVRVLATAAQAQALRDAAGATAEQTLLQDRIAGTEYTVQMMADAQARLHAVVPVRVGIKRGITLRATTENQPQVIAACRAIHAALPAAGCYNIQLMLTADGQVFPFEINPRVSTTLCLCVAAGLDPLAIYLAEQQPGVLLPFRSGLQLRRHWSNHFIGETLL